MNTKQKKFLLIGLITLAVNFLFPPWAFHYRGEYGVVGYSFILLPPNRMVVIDVTRLVLQIAAIVVVVIFFLLIFQTAQNPIEKENRKTDSESVKIETHTLSDEARKVKKKPPVIRLFRWYWSLSSDVRWLIKIMVFLLLFLLSCLGFVGDSFLGHFFGGLSCVAMPLYLLLLVIVRREN